MIGREDKHYKENIPVMKSCHEKRIEDLEENISEIRSCYEKRIEDLEKVYALCLFWNDGYPFNCTLWPCNLNQFKTELILIKVSSWNSGSISSKTKFILRTLLGSIMPNWLQFSFAKSIKNCQLLVNNGFNF